MIITLLPVVLILVDEADTGRKKRKSFLLSLSGVTFFRKGRENK
jgi:hypothetical protein